VKEQVAELEGIVWDRRQMISNEQLYWVCVIFFLGGWVFGGSTLEKKIGGCLCPFWVVFQHMVSTNGFVFLVKE
jgi:hypothetical protein